MQGISDSAVVSVMFLCYVWYLISTFIPLLSLSFYFPSTPSPPQLFLSLSPPSVSTPLPDYPPDVGYAQGMNDILTRFLVVTNSEVDSYWMFARYMERKRIDFLEETMMKKVGECVHVFTHCIVILNCSNLDLFLDLLSLSVLLTSSHLSLSQFSSPPHLLTSLSHTLLTPSHLSLTPSSPPHFSLTPSSPHIFPSLPPHPLSSSLPPHSLTSSPPHPLLFLTALVKKLIEEIDQELFQFFEGSECKDYLFCHRYGN